MNRFFLVITFLFFSLLGYTQSKIKVNFPGSESRTAHIWVYTDYMSYNKEELGVYKIDKKGNFEFKVYVKTPKPIFIQVEYLRVQLFIEPNRDYEIAFEKVDFNDIELYPKDVVGYLSPKYKILKPADQELNKGIEQSQQLFSSFIDSNYLSLTRGLNTKFLVDSFRYVMDSMTTAFGNPNLKRYTGYQLAQLQMLNHDYSTKDIVDNYFASDKLDIEDPLAMEFFNSFWSNYLLNKGKGYNHIQLDSVINIKKSYQALLALLANDPLLEDSILRELVIIRNIPQLYNNRKFSKKALTDILSDISSSKLRKQHQLMATNVRKRLVIYEQGTIAPEIKFTDIKDLDISLSTFEGKYIYINVWNYECMACLAELEYMKELYEEYDDVIAFVSISLDPNIDFMKNYVELKSYEWTFAPLDDNFNFLNDYNITNLPRYILLDRNGRVENVNAPSPSNRFSDYFLKMLNDKSGNLELKTNQ